MLIIPGLLNTICFKEFIKFVVQSEKWNLKWSKTSPIYRINKKLARASQSLLTFTQKPEITEKIAAQFGMLLVIGNNFHPAMPELRAFLQHQRGMDLGQMALDLDWR